MVREMTCIYHACARVHTSMARDRIQRRFRLHVLREEFYALFLNSPLNSTTVAFCRRVCYGIPPFAEHPDDVRAVKSEVCCTERKDQRLAGAFGCEALNLVRHLLVALVAVCEDTRPSYDQYQYTA